MWVSRRSMHPTHWLICAQVAGCTPQEQWDNIPLYGKLQIFVLVGMLESYGEGASQPDGYVHYMRGGKPGFYPEIKGKGGPGGHFLFNLWDPFNFTTKRTVSRRRPRPHFTPSPRRLPFPFVYRGKDTRNSRAYYENLNTREQSYTCPPWEVRQRLAGLPDEWMRGW